MEYLDFIEQYDLRTISYDKLQVLLSTAKDELVRYMRCTEDIMRKIKEIADLRKTLAEKLNIERQNTPIRVGCVLVVVALFVFLAVTSVFLAVTSFYLINKLGNEIIAILLGLSITLLVCILLWKYQKKFMRNLKDFLSSTYNAIKKCETELSILENNKEKAWNDFAAIFIIPDKYRYEYDLSMMLGYIKDKRADSWKECVKLFEDEEYQRRMEGHAQRTAKQAAIQAELARETRNAARWAAAGSWASAAGIWRINSKL